jgi:hypothetical protein
MLRRYEVSTNGMCRPHRSWTTRTRTCTWT